MSDTPRTDAIFAANELYEDRTTQVATLSRQLERELSLMQGEIERLKSDLVALFQFAASVASGQERTRADKAERELAEARKLEKAAMRWYRGELRDSMVRPIVHNEHRGKLFNACVRHAARREKP